MSTSVIGLKPFRIFRMSVHTSGTGWNDPPPQVIGDQSGKASIDNPYRRKIESTHKRSHPSGLIGDFALGAPGSNPQTHPSIMLPSGETHYPSDPNSPAVVRTAPNLIANSQHLHSYTSSSDSLDGFIPHPPDTLGCNYLQWSSGYASNVPYYTQASCPTNGQPIFKSPVSDKPQTDLANALSDRLMNLTLRNSPEQLILHSPLSSPGTFSPARRSRSPAPLSVIDNINPTFEIEALLEKVDYLRNNFKNSPDAVQYAEKLDTKIDVFVTNWPSLNSTLRKLIHKLVFCIFTNQTDVATKCFVKMSVEYSNDVMAWSMAFKRLISYFESHPISQ